MGTHRNPLKVAARALVATALTSCSPTSGTPSAHSVAVTARAAVEVVEVAPAPVGARTLDVPGFLPAILVVPSGIDSRPLVVAAHGAGGAPEWECDYWTRLTRGRTFVLCLRGTRINPQAGFYFRNHHALDAELTAAVAAARQTSSRIAVGSGIYAGFSQGASMGSLVVARHAEEFPYVVLIEGFQQWSGALARSFAQRGGNAVLFACGSRECARTADVSRRAVERAGLRSRAEHAQGAGHTPAGQVEALVASNIPWLLAGDMVW